MVCARQFCPAIHFLRPGTGVFAALLGCMPRVGLMADPQQQFINLSSNLIVLIFSLLI